MRPVTKLGEDKAAKKRADIPVDEPLFILRAQDDLAIPMLHRYKNFALSAECSPEFIADIDGDIEAFAVWREANRGRTKKPD